MKNKILLIITIAITALIFSACGGGGDDARFKNDGSSSGGSSSITIDIIDCNTSVAVIPDDYTSMYSEDVLVNETSNTVVTTYHDINGTKKVCTDSGKAHLIRGN